MNNDSFDKISNKNRKIKLKSKRQIR